MYDNTILNSAVQANTAVVTGGSTKNRQASTGEVGSWYEAMAKAWGQTLDGQANRITELSDKVGTAGHDNPQTITMLTAASMKMQFLSSNASTSTTSVGQALETLARK
ncbi:hypothetical protein [Allohahella sp. A8]|uniref:hypothetical protein n=1 Tax=Allohahella sp. A8 TaxID=3141461 RepID=UPI000C0A9E42|nr:hypothetical protein [Hahellaceae bacterium]|tara:strand:- start:23390 stop:23713 length:324 start_codon:yes stop_codon:yes gene_type:complete